MKNKLQDYFPMIRTREEILKEINGKKVKVVATLPNESRIADETSLLILDVLVKLEDENLAKAEKDLAKAEEELTKQQEELIEKEKEIELLKAKLKMNQ